MAVWPINSFTARFVLGTHGIFYLFIFKSYDQEDYNMFTSQLQQV